jgi:hypothetical protein
MCSILYLLIYDKDNATKQKIQIKNENGQFLFLKFE